MRTQVAIVGAGPSGLLLGQLLHKAGIDAVVLERQTRRLRARAHPRRRARAGDCRRARRGRRRRAHAREGLVHEGFEIGCSATRAIASTLGRLTGGRSVLVYGQTEVTRDLMEARAAAGLADRLRSRRCRAARLRRQHRIVTYRHAGRATHRIATSSRAATASMACVARACPAASIVRVRTVYPFGWLGLLADMPPVGTSSST